MSETSQASYLKVLYKNENPLQELSRNAMAAARRTNLAPFRGHLGNPMGPQHEPSNQLLSRYFAARGGMPENRGYADVAGHPEIREVIALALNKINRLDGDKHITGKNVLGVTGGTGALNIALSIADDPTILVTEPYYPPWDDIAQRLSTRIDTFPLDANSLLDETTLEQVISRNKQVHPGKPLVLIYHYPHNPTGKTLTEEEAREMGAMFSRLCEKHPELFLVQEDLYLATIASNRGIYTPLSYLEGAAKEKVTWLHSPSKMGHPQDRGAVVAAFNDDLLLRLRGALSFDMLGTSTGGLLATASTLAAIAQGGVDAKRDDQVSPTRQTNFRYEVAAFYQERLKILHDALMEIDRAAPLDSGISVIGEMPGGAYYLYPDFSCLRGKNIPEELLPAFKNHENTAFRNKTTFENAEDIAVALENAELIGLLPMTVAPGTLFEKDPCAMTMRISTIEPDLEIIREGANTLKGIVQKTLGVDLGATFNTLEERQQTHRQKQAATPHAERLNLRQFLVDEGLLQQRA